MRRAARIDANQNAIVSDLRKMGASVAITSALGKGFPDIVVGWQGGNYLFEIKNPAQKPSDQALSEDELSFSKDWRGSYFVIKSAEEAMLFIKHCQFMAADR